MSKRHGKTRQTNPNHTRSKNNPKGKRNDPKTNWSAPIARVEAQINLRDIAAIV